MNIKRGDKVIIIKGKDRGKSGNVIRVLKKESRVTVEGLNMVKRNVKPKRQGEKGQIVGVPAPLSVSNVKLICRSCGKPTRVGYRFIDSKKERYCKRCKATN